MGCLVMHLSMGMLMFITLKFLLVFVVDEFVNPSCSRQGDKLCWQNGSWQFCRYSNAPVRAIFLKSVVKL